MSFAHERLTARPHDRIALYRRDESWLDQRYAEADSQVLVVSGTRVRPRDGAVEWLPSAEAPEGTRILLGERDGRTWWAVVTGPEQAASKSGVEAEAWLPLRGLMPTLAAGAIEQAPLVLHALGLAEWLWVTRFCPRCGGELVPRAAGHELECTQCSRRQFPRSDPAVIMTVTAGEPGSAEERCLLGRQAVWPEGRFSTLAGFCEPGETLEDAVRREVAEETGVLVGDVAYFGNQPWPMPASLMVGFIGRALTEEIQVDADEIEEARWFTREEMREQAEAGTLVLPGGVSISRSLVEGWYGGSLPGNW